MIFQEQLTGRYINTTAYRIWDACTNLTIRMNLFAMDISANDFFREIGIPEIPQGDYAKWRYKEGARIKPIFTPKSGTAITEVKFKVEPITEL